MSVVQVVLISDCFPPRGGGIETQVAGLAERVSAAGWSVTVATATRGQGGAEGYRVERMPLPIRGVPPVNPWAGPRLAHVVSGADVVHAHVGVVSPFAEAGVAAALRAGVPVAVSTHSFLGGDPVARRSVALWQRWAAAGARVCAVSRAAASAVERLSGGWRPAVLPNGVDAHWWGAEGHPVGARQATAPDGAVCLVTAARLVPRKRLGALVAAVERGAAAAGVPMELAVYGAGWAGAAARRAASRSRWSSVRWQGAVSPAALRTAYRGADAFVSAARLEAFGLAAAEARSAGLPVIARADSGTADVITHGRDGLLAADDDELAAHIAAMADGGLRSRLAGAASGTPAYDWSQVVPQVLGLYGELIGQGGEL